MVGKPALAVNSSPIALYILVGIEHRNPTDEVIWLFVFGEEIDLATPHLVLIHGLIGSLNYFDPQSRLTEAHIHTVDLLGYGTFRTHPMDKVTLAEQAQHVLCQLDRKIKDRAAPIWLLGHSMGGAVVQFVLDHAPSLIYDRIYGVINVEGNLTIKDAFWSSKIAKKSLSEWEADFRQQADSAEDWLTQCGVIPTPQRIDWARQILDNQPASTLHHMSRAILTETIAPAYLDSVRQALDRGKRYHLIAGERSASDWDVPAFLREQAGSCREIPQTGHLMMLEAPDLFTQAVHDIYCRSE